MQLERIVQISMATFVALGTMLLGMGQHSLLWPLAAILASVGSVYLTDIKQVFIINNTTANIAAWAALILSLWHLNSLADVDSLQAMSELLVYLQFILLFKQKNIRNYWLLTVSSLLQVSVGAALSVDVMFGIVLVLYMFVGLTAMTFFYLYREQQVHASLPASTVSKTPPSARWPLAHAKATIEASPVGTSLGVGWDLYRRILSSGLLTMIIASLVFLFVPRIDRASWRLGGGPQQHVVGFSPEVQLGEFGQIVESPNRVMRIRFSDPVTDRPYLLSEPPLLRGVTLTHYSAGRWQRNNAEEQPSMLPGVRRLPPEVPLVRQTIEVEPLDTDILFCVHPPVAFPRDRGSINVLYNREGEYIYRPKGMRSHEFNFELLTYGFDKSRQRAILPSRLPLDETQRAELLKLPQVDDHVSVPGLILLAQQVVAGIPASDPIRRAQALDRFLRTDPRFKYSLSSQPRDPALDPIEDFVTGHPTGHCEYFASALALMLRSIGIPTRMAVGFRAGTYNNSTHWYEVQQLHAHTWVEAYLAAGEFDAAMLPFSTDNGAWMTLDPTPGLDLVEESESGYASYFRMMRDYAQTFWSEYVLGMDAERQRESVYTPVSESISGVARRLLDGSRWWQQRLARWLPLDDESSEDGGTSKGWTFFGLVVIALVLAAAAWTIFLFVRRRWRWRFGRSSKGRAQRSNVEFYRRLEALLARQRLIRSAAQTQREFALSAGGQLSETPRTAGVAALPRRVVDAFYRVRFGRQPLDNLEAQAVEEALSQLENTLGR